MTAEDIDGVPFAERIAVLGRERADTVALTFVDLGGTKHRLTWGGLDRRANQLGRALAGRGVGLGDRVGLELPNSVEMVEATLAAWKVGASPVPVRWDLPDWERGRVAEVLDPALMVRADSSSLFDEADSQSADPLPLVVSPNVSGICSSGSTGTPKIIMDHTPAVLTAMNAQPFPTAWGVDVGSQRILVPTALYHTNGFAQFTYLLVGDTLTLMAKFDAARAVDLIEEERITAFTATPTMLARIARLPGIERRDLSSLVWVQQGAATIPPSLVRTWTDLIGAERLYMCYGMTERLGLTAIRGDEWLEHPGSIGRGFRGTEIRILDENQHDVAPGEVGEIYLRSLTTGKYGYLGSNQALPMTADGFATAGDLGWLDADGYLYIADRRVDMIVSGGANVFPAEVEAALSEHPGIADVVVVGLPDPEWGHRVHAIVERAAAGDVSEDEVRSFAKERLAAYKVPKTVEFVDSIPRSAATKVNRANLVAERVSRAGAPDLTG